MGKRMISIKSGLPEFQPSISPSNPWLQLNHMQKPKLKDILWRIWQVLFQISLKPQNITDSRGLNATPWNIGLRLTKLKHCPASIEAMFIFGFFCMCVHTARVELSVRSKWAPGSSSSSSLFQHQGYGHNPLHLDVWRHGVLKRSLCLHVCKATLPTDFPHPNFRF